MFELLRIPLTKTQWVYLGLLQGACGALVALCLGMVWAALHGEWMEVVSAPLWIPCLTLAGGVNAIMGIPVYRWLTRQVAGADRAGSEAIRRDAA